jgi:streptomycin 6-kinase
MNNLPSRFIDRYLKMYGEEGETWLKGFPVLRDELRKRWSLTNHRPLSGLSYNYLEYARTTEGEEVVLKIGFPNPELETEIQALRQYNGNGAIKIINADPQKGALLLERVHPGTNLLSVSDNEKAIRIACQVMTNLWLPAPEGNQFPSMDTWCRGFDRYQKTYGKSGPVPNEIIQDAQTMSKELLDTQSEHLLLHGDLHHMNILRSKEGMWLAIDPKGVLGEKAFEVAPLLYNPVSDLQHKNGVDQIVDLRLEVLIQHTDLDHYRILLWSYVRTALSLIWEIEEEGQNVAYWLWFLELLRDKL